MHHAALRCTILYFRCAHRLYYVAQLGYVARFGQVLLNAMQTEPDVRRLTQQPPLRPS